MLIYIVILVISYMDAKLAKIYYSPQGYWKGIAAVKKLASAAEVLPDTAKRWLVKQALWQVYLPPPRYIPRPKFDVFSPNAVHQADLLFLRHDTLGQCCQPLQSSGSSDTKRVGGSGESLSKIYNKNRQGGLRWPQLLQVDPGREFMGAVTKAMENHKRAIRRGRVDIHRDQAIVERFNQTLAERLFGYHCAGREFMGAVTKAMENHKRAIRLGRVDIYRDQAIVERFNRTLAERLFGYQYAVEMRDLVSKIRSTAWVKRLPEMVSALNNEVTRLTGKKPAEAIKEKAVYSKPSTVYSRPVGLNDKKLPPRKKVRYLYQPGELEGGSRRAADPICL